MTVALTSSNGIYYPSTVMSGEGSDWTRKNAVKQSYAHGAVRYVEAYTGDDIGAKVNAAIADLPDDGGLVVSPSGDSTWSTAVDYGSLDAGQVRLVVPVGTFTFTVDCTFSGPVEFIGGILKRSGTVEVTFDYPIIAPLVRVFNEDGRTPNVAGGFKFSITNPQTIVYPQWWGAVADGADNATLFIQQAIDSVTYSSTANKTGEVHFPSGRYKMADGIFVGYDFLSEAAYIADWTNRTNICKADHADTPQGRKQRVLLKGLGKVVLRGSGAGEPKYLVYYAASSTGQGFDIIDDFEIHGNTRQWRGIYASYMRYGDTIKNIKFNETGRVGLDYLDCWGGRLSNIKGYRCSGHIVRGRQANSCYGETLASSAGYGARDDNWPDPAETFIRGYDGVIQTAVEDRVQFYLSGNNSTWRNVLVESSSNGSPMMGTIDTAGTKLSKVEHGLAVTDLVWFPDATPNEATTVIAATSSSFTMNDAGVAGSSKVVYRRATSISRANPCVVTCQNHGQATGQRVRIVDGSGSGMGELDDEGPWYVMTRLTDDTFSLQDFTGTDKDTSDEDVYTASDGSEYLCFGASGIYFDSDGGSLQGVRFEGNEIPYAKIIVPDTVVAATIKDVLLGDRKNMGAAYEGAGQGDWAVELRDRVNSCCFSNIYGNLRRAAVLFRFSDADPGDMYAHGNHVSEISLFNTVPTGVVEYGHPGTAAQLIEATEGNYIEGGWTPINTKSGDETPSVWGFHANDASKNYLGYWAVRVRGPVLRIPDGTFNLTNFDDGVEAQELPVLLLGTSATVVHDVTKINLTANTNFTTSSSNVLLRFINVSDVWHQT